MTQKHPTIMNEKAALAARYSSQDNEGASAAPSSSMPSDPPAYDAVHGSSQPSRPRAQTHQSSPFTLLPSAPSIPQMYSHIPLPRYHIPGATLSLDKTIQTIYSAELSSNPSALEDFLAEQMKLPPRPTVRIIARVPNHPLPLFDLHLDLFGYVAGINGEQSGDECGKWAFTKVKGMDAASSSSGSRGMEPLKMDEKAALFDGRPDPTGAGFYVRRFCADNSYSKKLILHRTVQNWDTAHLTVLLRSMLMSTGYRGPPLDISFPVHYSTLVIHSPHKHAAALTGLRSLFVKTTAYEPLEAIWPYATAPRSGDADLDKKQRECVRQNEEDWLAEWRGAIMVGVSERKRGWVGESDKVDALLAGPTGVHPEMVANVAHGVNWQGEGTIPHGTPRA